MTRETRHFGEELEELKRQLLAMGGLAQERVREALHALVERDHDLMAGVIAGDEPVNRFHLEIDDRCFKLLALHQPMAIDLRTIVSIVKINGDLERVGDLAVNIGEAVQRYLEHAPVKPLIDLPRMAALVQRMLQDALDAFMSRNVAIARAVLSQDDLLNEIGDQMFRELLTYMLGNPRTIEPGIDLVLISRHLERVGDHATNIAEDVIFIVEGRDVRHLARDRTS